MDARERARMASRVLEAVIAKLQKMATAATIHDLASLVGMLRTVERYGIDELVRALVEAEAAREGDRERLCRLETALDVALAWGAAAHPEWDSRSTPRWVVEGLLALRPAREAPEAPDPVLAGPSRRTWNYRVVRLGDEEGGFGFGIHEVHYDEAGRPRCFTAEPTAVSSVEGFEGLFWSLGRMREALDRPLLTEADFPAVPGEEVS